MNSATNCNSCAGTGVVCETCGTRWELAEGGTCCGAGKFCACNPDGKFKWGYVLARTPTAGNTEDARSMGAVSELPPAPAAPLAYAPAQALAWRMGWGRGYRAALAQAPSTGGKS